MTNNIMICDGDENHLPVNLSLVRFINCLNEERKDRTRYGINFVFDRHQYVIWWYEDEGIFNKIRNNIMTSCFYNVKNLKLL